MNEVLIKEILSICIIQGSCVKKADHYFVKKKKKAARRKINQLFDQIFQVDIRDYIIWYTILES